MSPTSSTDASGTNNAGASTPTSTMYDAVAGTAQRIYPIASNVVGEMTGFAALSESDPAAPTQPTQSAQPTESNESNESNELPTRNLSASDGANERMARDDHDEEHQRGPSESSRVDQPQHKIGTESGIPTTAGAGTTLSPDQDVAPAADKAKQKRNNAAVGVDYSDQPCPTADARRSQASSSPAEGKTQFVDRQEQLHGSEQGSHCTSQSSHDKERYQDQDQAQDQEQGQEQGQEHEQAQQSSAGWKNKLKANTKLAVGKITHNQTKIDDARAMKADATPAAV